MTPRILILQHHPTSPAGMVGLAIHARQWRSTLLDGARGTVLPADAAEHDGLLILGGDMSALADERCPHFPALLDLARLFAAAEKPVLGICLGGQLLARAFGAGVRLGAAPEFGVTTLLPTGAAAGDPLLADAPQPFLAMQWHDDSFDIPTGAVPLLSSRACANQAFRVGRSVWAFQCHLEADRATIRAWGHERARSEGDPARIEQAAADAERFGDAAEAFGRHLADRWLEQCRARPGD